MRAIRGTLHLRWRLAKRGRWILHPQLKRRAIPSEDVSFGAKKVIGGIDLSAIHEAKSRDFILEAEGKSLAVHR